MLRGLTAHGRKEAITFGEVSKDGHTPLPNGEKKPLVCAWELRRFHVF